jgi:hypothetical protein
LLVTDSMSTSARVSSNRSMIAFWGGTDEKGRAEENSGLSLLDSAPSA